MSDRALLEAAARAAGYEPVCWADDYPGGLLLAGEQESWNPLADDGDALRLAVKLNLSVFPNDYPKDARPYALTEAGEPDRPQTGMAWWDECGDDGSAATRLAIVRCAAAIGNKLEKSE